MQDGSEQLGGAVGVDAAVVDFALGADDFGSADRALLRDSQFPSCRGDDLLSSSITLATLGITSPPRSTCTQSPIFTPRRSISSMLCRVALRTVVPPIGNRRQFGDGREFPGAANLPANVFQFRDSRARGVLVGDRPARSFAGEAEFVLQAGAIDFDDDAVDLVGQRIALGFPLLDEGPDFVHRVNQLVVRVDFESGGVERAERLRVAVEIRTAVFEQDVGEKVHAAFRRNIRVELANGAGGEIARVGECRQAVRARVLR